MTELLPVRERIVLAFLAALGAAVPAVAGLVVERERLADLGADELPRVILYEGDEDDGTLFCGEDGYLLDLIVEVYAVGAGEDVATLDLDLTGGAAAVVRPVKAETALAIVRAAVHRAALADLTLGGLARTLDFAGDGPTRLVFDQMAPVRGASLTYRVRYATAEGDPFTPMA